MKYITSESVSNGHPDKVADQIADAILHAHPHAHVAIEVMVTGNTVVIGGEISSLESIKPIEPIVRDTIRAIGYTKPEYGFCADTCTIHNLIQPQSKEIKDAVDDIHFTRIGAGDQGTVYGYAVAGNNRYMPMPIDLANIIMRTLNDIRQEGKLMPYLRPDGKCQVTVLYGDDDQPIKIDNIVLSVQHDEGLNNKHLESNIRKILLPRITARYPEYKHLLTDGSIVWHFNPSGSFVQGGPIADTGVTGRKMMVDTYGGCAVHGGGAFSGKDATKVDRSGAYMARYIAKNMVAAGVAREMTVALSYAIGEAEPVAVQVDTKGTGRLSDELLSKYIRSAFDLRPGVFCRRLELYTVDYRQTAAFGHFGRDDQQFPWEELNKVMDIRKDLCLKNKEDLSLI